jgi:hypothetical protein
VPQPTAPPLDVFFLFAIITFFFP